MAKGKQTGIPLQLVGSCSSYCEDHYEKLLKYVKAPVQVVTDITDLIVMKKVKMVQERGGREGERGQSRGVYFALSHRVSCVVNLMIYKRSCCQY